MSWMHHAGAFSFAVGSFDGLEDDGVEERLSAGEDDATVDTGVSQMELDAAGEDEATMCVEDTGTELMLTVAAIDEGELKLTESTEEEAELDGEGTPRRAGPCTTVASPFIPIRELRRIWDSLLTATFSS